MNFRNICIEFNNLAKKNKVSHNGIYLRAVMIYNIICREGKDLSLRQLMNKFYDYYRSTIPSPSVSRCINVLKKLGLVFKIEDERDSRQKVVKLTYQGNQLKHQFILETGLPDERKGVE